MLGYAETPHVTLSLTELARTRSALNAVVSGLPSLDAAYSTRSGESPMVKLAAILRTWPAQGTTRLTGLSRQTDALEMQLANAKRSVDNNMSSLGQSIQGLSQEQATLESAIQEAKNTIDKQKVRLDEALDRHQSSVTQDFRERDTEWEAWIEAKEAAAAQHDEVMQANLSQSTTVLGQVGVNVTASDYLEYATAQARSADRWRMYASWMFILAGAVFTGGMLLTFLGVGGQAQWWELALQRIGAPLGLAGVAAFMAREAGQHRQEARGAKSTQLTLTALEPFIANLPEEQKRKIRYETAQRLFAPLSKGASETAAEKVAPAGP